MQAFKRAVLVTSLASVAGCADLGPLFEGPLFEWDPYFVHQRDVCFDKWYGYWDPPCPPPPMKAVAAAPTGYSDELFALQQENAALRRRISELEQQGRAVAVAPVGSSDELFRCQQENAALRRRITEMEQLLAARDRELNQARARIAELERQLAASKETKLGPARGSAAPLETAKQGLVRALRPEIEKGDIAVDLNSERLLIKLASSYLFGSGEADLKPGGADALKKVGEILKDYPEYKVAVEGHTDDRPIRSTLKKKFATNQDLSEARAANAAKALAEGGRSSLSTAGFADTKPVAPNSTEAGRAKNRRVEIRVTE